ncbi:MAG TPA: MBL fold metallo-hydrolase [Sandaracinaceae bacterium LLY-WYZ-13_1]|nr:MBL fold metallo-hydrolase [Sandaracinaceae bacterium LLY-WYZ-13_1]
MRFERIVSDGIAHHSYFIADGGEAIVIDPRRDVDVYLELARQQGARIRFVCETHRNEDYAIGSTALKALAGAEILHSGAIDFEYGTAVREGDAVKVGSTRLGVLETPGHTDESLSFTLADTSETDDPFAVFTGDALFVGDTGRTDLYGEDEKERLARDLHQSLFEKLLPLGDGVLLFPAHGSGSVCGGDISDRDMSSLGFERLHNAKLEAELDAFVKMKTQEPHLVPPYFRRMEEWNQKGNAPIHARVPVPPPLSPGEVAERVEGGALVIDARLPQAYAGGHIPGSLNIWQGGLSAYLGWMVEHGTPIVLVLPEHASVEAVTRILMRIGYDEVVGYLRGGFESWQNDGRLVGRIGTLDTRALRAKMRAKEVTVLDVRKPSEWEDEAVEGALRIFVGDLPKRLDEVPKDRPVVSMCAVGHRGGIGASVLARHGFEAVYNYLGGAKAWKQEQ